jgi:hypothetical protein
MAMIYMLPLSYGNIDTCRQAVGCHGHITLKDYVAVITDRYKGPASKRMLTAFGYTCRFRTTEIHFKTNANLS